MPNYFIVENAATLVRLIILNLVQLVVQLAERGSQNQIAFFLLQCLFYWLGGCHQLLILLGRPLLLGHHRLDVVDDEGVVERVNARLVRPEVLLLLLMMPVVLVAL